MAKLLLLFMIFNHLVFAKETTLPQLTDYSKNPTLNEYHPQNDDFWELGYYGFNAAPELLSTFAYLKSVYKINTVVETGTYIGCTTVPFSQLFSKVHTIEINDEWYESSKKKLEHLSNVVCHKGSSEQVLAEILPSLSNEPVMFYLDAHWNDDWPLLAELEEISKTHHDNCIIVIDDFKVPSRPDLFFDSYGEHECSYEYIKAQLGKVFTSYTIHYIIPRLTDSKAKFIAIPEAWDGGN